MDPKFWSDDFDADLLKLVPGVREQLGEDAGIVLRTFCGHPTHGRINLPCSWNSHSGLTALFFLSEPPVTQRDGKWVTLPGGYTTDAEIVECTWLEVLRDEWVHGCNVSVEGVQLLSGDSFGGLCMRLMYDARGWQALSDALRAELHRSALQMIAGATADLKALVVKIPEGA